MEVGENIDVLCDHYRTSYSPSGVIVNNHKPESDAQIITSSKAILNLR